MKRALFAVVLAGAMTFLPALAATPAQAYPTPPKTECFGPRHTTVTMTDVWAPWNHSYWHLNFTWCSTDMLWGRTFGQAHWHSVSSLDGLLSDVGIVENRWSYYTYNGHPYGGIRIHVKGHLVNSFFGWNCNLYPSGNAWLHYDGSYHTSHSLDDC